MIAGDDSQVAATELERVILDKYSDDDRFSDLAEALALYAPGNGMPYYEADELRAVLRRTIRDLGLRDSDVERGGKRPSVFRLRYSRCHRSRRADRSPPEWWGSQ